MRPYLGAGAGPGGAVDELDEDFGTDEVDDEEEDLGTDELGDD